MFRWFLFCVVDVDFDSTKPNLTSVLVIWDCGMRAAGIETLLGKGVFFKAEEQ